MVWVMDMRRSNITQSYVDSEGDRPLISSLHEYTRASFKDVDWLHLRGL